jgi:penicillin G amidase
MQSWDYVMSREQKAPLLYEVWLDRLERRVRLAQAGPQVGDVPLPLPRLIQLTATTSDSLVLAGWEDAVTDLEHRLGTDRSRWIWGALHRASFPHPIAAAFDLPAVPRGGDGYTVNATGGPAYVQKYGGSYREILDFADWDHSVATSTPGQSGQPGSPYYGDLLPLWAEGEYFPLVYSRAAVERETAHVLTLTPTPDARPRDAGHD